MTLGRKAIVIIGGSLLGLMAFLYATLRANLSRLSRLSGSLAKISAGDLSARVPRNGKDGLSSLADEINNPSESLERSQQRRQKNENQYRILFERNMAGIYRSTLDGHILECNEAFARIFGYASPDEALTPECDLLRSQAATRQALLGRLKQPRAITNHET